MAQGKAGKKKGLPQALVEATAQAIWKERVARGLEGNPERDWEAARRYCQAHPEEVIIWKVKRGLMLPCRWLWSGARKLGKSLVALLRLVGQGLTFPVWLLGNYLPPLFADTDSRNYAMDVVKAIISGLTLIGTAVAAGGLFFSYSQNQKLYSQNQERLITERFAKAVEQLGAVNAATKKKEETVRIGGIFSLERIAKDSPKDQWTIMEVLTSYIRKESPKLGQAPPAPDGYSESVEEQKKRKRWQDWFEKNKVNIDVQTALTVIGRRNSSNDNYSDQGWFGWFADKEQTENDIKKQKNIDLSNSNLVAARLDGARLDGARLDLASLDSASLDGARLDLARLYGASLDGARLDGARLYGANLYGASLYGASLDRAHLDLASLYGASLYGASLYGASLDRARLDRARLDRAHLDRAFLENAGNLSKQQIKSACNWEKAIYKGDWDWGKGEAGEAIADEPANQKYIASLKQDKSSNPKKPVDCSQWK